MNQDASKDFRCPADPYPSAAYNGSAQRFLSEMAGLAPYEVPSKIEILDKIPKSPLGKVLKKELRVAPKPTPAVQVAPAAQLMPAMKEVA